MTLRIIVLLQATCHCNMQRLLLGYDVIHPNATIKQYAVNCKKWRQRRSYFLCCIVREATTIIFFMLQEAMMLNHHKMWGITAGVMIIRPTRQSHFYMLSIAMMMAMCLFFRLHCKEQKQKTRVDCNKGEWDHTKQEPTKFLLCIARASNNHKTMTSLMQWSIFSVICPIARIYNNDNISFCCITGSNTGSWLWQARKIASATTNLFHWSGSTTSTIVKAQSTRDNTDHNALTTLGTQ